MMDFVSVFRTLLLTLALAVVCVTGTQGKDAPPNVVIILADDIRWSDYGFMGHEAIRTPRLDRLALESLVYTRGYVPTSLCRTSLMSLISGQYPHQHGITGNDPPKGTPREKLLKYIDRAPTIPKLLMPRGYLSLQTGKWWEGSYERGGFTHGMSHGDPTRGGRHGDDGLKIGRQGIEPIRKFLDETGGKPFFLWYAPMLPHQPHNPPPRLLEKYRDKTDSPHVAKYWAMCEWFDETCGELLDELAERKLSESTLVIYLADNGWVQDPMKAAFGLRSKRSRYDGGLRTPMMLRWPGRIAPGRDERTLVSSIDIAPTILAACGAKPDPRMPGVDLRDATKARERDAVYGAVFEHDIPDIDQPASGLQHRWCIAGEWKLTVDAHGKTAELFNVVSDPDEQAEVSAKHLDAVAKLRKKLDAWWDP